MWQSSIYVLCYLTKYRRSLESKTVQKRIGFPQTMPFSTTGPNRKKHVKMLAWILASNLIKVQKNGPL
jgi:hypothetical protein